MIFHPWAILVWLPSAYVKPDLPWNTFTISNYTSKLLNCFILEDCVFKKYVVNQWEDLLQIFVAFFENLNFLYNNSYPVDEILNVIRTTTKT